MSEYVEGSATAFVARAEAMVPALMEIGQEADALRRLPDETVAALCDAGFMRMLQPKRYGGFAMNPLDFFDVQRVIARGCPSTGWVLGVLGIHAWQLALFDSKAQDEVWQSDPDALISSSYAPVGKVTVVEGGYRISGRWSFSSGSDHCGWAFLGGFVPTAEGTPPDMRTFLLPRSDYRVVDTWHVSGLKATGSNDVIVEDAFVPEHRTHRFRDGFLCDNPGNKVNPEAVYRLPFGQVFVRSVSTAAIGIAEGTLQCFCDNTRKRVSTADQSKMDLDPTSQHVAADAAMTIANVKAVMRADLTRMLDQTERGESIPIDERVRARYASSDAVDQCKRVVGDLFTNSGGRALFRGNPINRYFQDIHAVRAHYANNPAKPGRNLGRVLLGGKTTDFFI